VEGIGGGGGGVGEKKKLHACFCVKVYVSLYMSVCLSVPVYVCASVSLVWRHTSGCKTSVCRVLATYIWM